MAYRAVLPVLVITGFLGSGKTTLVNQVLRGASASGARLGVVVNDFGEIGIDGALIGESTDDVVELADGCLCCRNTGDLEAALRTLTTRADHLDGVIVETSGLADPTGVIELVANSRIDTPLALVGALTVVDCAEFDANLRHATVAYRQIVAADLFVLSKTSLAPAADVSRIPSRLATLNSVAPAVLDTEAVGAVASLLSPDETGGFTAAARAPGPGTADSSPRQHVALPVLTHTLSLPLDRACFTEWIDGLDTTVVRVKGLVTFDGDARALTVDRIGARTTFRLAPPTARRVLKDNDAVLVLFGTGAGRALDALLTACTKRVVKRKDMAQ
ncbi:CobW family GTP-binding protein [Actinacidiphila glaucinigra]|uniref:CobW family GTP-binding protein n=1 Tax=Actinacidiphila glaucinigra TaxID=235986 RepID=UPI0035E125D2